MIKLNFNYQPHQWSLIKYFGQLFNLIFYNFSHFPIGNQNKAWNRFYNNLPGHMISYSWVEALGQWQFSVSSLTNNFELKSRGILFVLIVELFLQCKIKSSVVERLPSTCSRALMCSGIPPWAWTWYLESPTFLSFI